MIKTLVKRLPIMICPKWVNVKTQPIDINDVLEYIMRSLEIPSTQSLSIDIGGSIILSYRDMTQTVAWQMQLRRLIIPVPILTPWLSLHWVNLVTTASAPLARALIELVRSETICVNDLAEWMFDFQPIDFEEAVAKALAQEGAKTTQTQPERNKGKQL
jgi:uncharacterized protein YbjT (DUF2867 family)